MKTTFQGQELFIGIDVHKKSWTVSIIGEYNEHKTFSQPPEAIALHNYLEKHFPGAKYKAAYEAGFSGFHTCSDLRSLGIECIVVNAADVPTNDKEKKRKSDPVDSRKIAKGLRSGDLEAIYVPSEELQKDRSVLRYRNKLVNDQTRCKNRIKNHLFFYGIKIPLEYDGTTWNKGFLEWLEHKSETDITLSLLIEQFTSTKQMLLKVSKEVVRLAQCEKYKQEVILLQSIPGIGRLTAINLVLELAEMERFSSFDKLCSYVGLVPNVHCSGESERVGEMTSRGNDQIKKYLIESSWIVVRKDPEMMLAFTILCKRMKKNQAIIRIAKKMLSRIRAVLTSGKPYEINHNL